MAESSSFEIIKCIKEIYSLMNTQIGCSMKGSGLTPQQTMVIKVLAHSKEVTMTQLCEELSLAKATVSGIVQRLEDAGYVTKVKKDEDKRSTYITFSEKGRVFASQFRNTMNHSFSDLFTNFTPEELIQIQSALNLLIQKMKEND
ncbi:MAG: MarR family winged helix-turn-helix transcriptional regulator [Cellulosilyticaceae bacterium]